MASEWQTVRLGDVVQNLDARRIPVKAADRRPGTYPYYGASGVIDHVDDYLFEGLHLLVAEDGENLRTRKTPISFLADGRFWVNNHAHILRGTRMADTRFLHYALSATDVSGYLSGSTQPKLTQDNLHRIRLRMPPLAIQRAIASILGALDGKIELNRKMSQTLDAMLMMEFRQRFSSALETSPQSALPAGWSSATVDDVVEVRGGTTPPTKNRQYWENGTHYFCTPKDMSQLGSPVLLATERRVTDEGLAKTGSGLLPKGTVLMSSRAPIGYVAIALDSVSVNQGIIAMICGERVPPSYMLCWARASQDGVVSRANGSTFLEISKGNFKSMPCVVPTSSDLQAFAEVANHLIERVATCEREVVLLAKVRDTVLPGLVSGRLRVADVV